MINYTILSIFKDPSHRHISYFINSVAGDEIPSSLIVLLQQSLLLFKKESGNNPNMLPFLLLLLDKKSLEIIVPYFPDIAGR